ncbi:hypothetical protein FACS1894162_7700 [Bacteroidia bacterium]|nr:hypothetical protein FACS1894162_7700 [Bacteroidia bacterium]
MSIINKMAVACPLLLNIGCRKGTMINNNKIETNCNLVCHCTLMRFLFDKLKYLGSKTVVDNGQTFRHKPVANTNKAGAIGINIFQKMSTPVLGKKTKAKKIANPIIQNIICMSFHMRYGF